MDVTSAGRARVAAGREVGLDALGLLGVPVLGAPLELDLGLSLGLTLDGLVEGLLGGEDGVALATFGEALVLEDLRVVLLDKVKTTSHLTAGSAGVAAASLDGLDLRLGRAGLVAGHAGVAAERLVGTDTSLSLGVGVTLEDRVDSVGEGVLDGAERATGLVASHAGVATERLVGTDPRLSVGEGVGNGLSSTLGLVACHARVTAEALVGTDPRLGLSLSEGTSREGQDGEDGSGDLHVGGRSWCVLGVGRELRVGGVGLLSEIDLRSVSESDLWVSRGTTETANIGVLI